MGLGQGAMHALAARVFGSDPARVLALLRAVWPRAVGAELARRTELLAIEGQTLRVRVPDAAWRKELHRMQRDILRRLRDSVGAVAPRRLGFAEGLPAQSPETTRGDLAMPQAPPVPQSAEQLAPQLARESLPPAVVAEAQGIGDPEIRRRFLETAAGYLARAARRRRHA